MRMVCSLLTTLMFLTISSGVALPKGKKQRLKKRVAVFLFDDKTDRSFGWWNKKGVGQGISDMLITELTKTGNYSVIERAELDKILAEQNLGAQGIVTSESAAQAGKVLGVEIALLGAVTEFGYKKSDTGGRFKSIGIGVQSQSATVALDCRLVNTTTGEIISAENMRKEKSSKGLKVNTRKIDFRSQKDFDESLVGKAARDAVKDVINLLDKKAPEIPWQAKIVTEQGGVVFINAGAESGVQTNDTFVIYRAGEALTDPDTGLSLGSIDSKIGSIRVVDNQIGNGKASKCQIVSGSGFERGDFVRLE